jgi:Spy/CpxP family protein refolding chaperone
MKTAYELAMERLNKLAPTVKLTDKQKQALAELDSKYAARLAEREITLQGEIEQAAARGDAEAMEKLQQRLADDRKSIQTELEARKETVRQGGQ